MVSAALMKTEVELDTGLAHCKKPIGVSHLSSRSYLSQWQSLWRSVQGQALRKQLIAEFGQTCDFRVHYFGNRVLVDGFRAIDIPRAIMRQRRCQKPIRPNTARFGKSSGAMGGAP